MVSDSTQKIINNYAGKVKIVKMNIDENPNTPPKYGIRSIPTLMLFKNGAVESTKIGGLNKSQLTEFLDEHAWLIQRRHNRLWLAASGTQG